MASILPFGASTFASILPLGASTFASIFGTSIFASTLPFTCGILIFFFDEDDEEEEDLFPLILSPTLGTSTLASILPFGTSTFASILPFDPSIFGSILGTSIFPSTLPLICGTLTFFFEDDDEDDDSFPLILNPALGTSTLASILPFGASTFASILPFDPSIFGSILGTSIFPSTLPLICGTLTFFFEDDDEDDDSFPLILNPTLGTSTLASILPFGASTFASILGNSIFASALPLTCGTLTFFLEEDEEDEEDAFFPFRLSPTLGTSTFASIFPFDPSIFVSILGASIFASALPLTCGTLISFFEDDDEDDPLPLMFNPPLGTLTFASILPFGASTFTSILGASIFPSPLTLACGTLTFLLEDEEEDDCFPLILSPIFGTSTFASSFPFGASTFTSNFPFDPSIFASVLGTSILPPTFPLISGTLTFRSDDEEDEECFPLILSPIFPSIFPFGASTFASSFPFGPSAFTSILGASIFPSALTLICGIFASRSDDEESEDLFPFMLNPTFGTSTFPSILALGASTFALILPLGASTFASNLGACTFP